MAIMINYQTGHHVACNDQLSQPPSCLREGMLNKFNKDQNRHHDTHHGNMLVIIRIRIDDGDHQGGLS